MQRTQAWTNLQVSSLLSLFCPARRCYINAKVENTTLVWPSCEPYELQYQLVLEYVPTIIRVCSGWIWGLLHGPEPMHGTAVSVKSTQLGEWLVKHSTLRAQLFQQTWVWFPATTWYWDPSVTPVLGIWPGPLLTSSALHTRGPQTYMQGKTFVHTK